MSRQMQETRSLPVTGASLAFGCFLALALLNFALINFFALNFPNSDDFSAILEPVLSGVESGSVSSAVHAIFTPHTQHFQVMLRVVAWISYFAFGEVNFRFIIFVGALWWIPFAVYLRRETAATGWLLAGAGLLLFQPQYSEATQWATNAVPFLWINTFALLAFWYADREPTRPIVSALFSVAAVLTWGNGIFVPFLAAGLCVLRKRPPWLAVGHGLVGVAAVSLYAFVGREAMSRATPGGLPILDAAIYFVRLLGCSAGFYSRTSSLVWGSGVLVAFAAALFFRWRKRSELRGLSWTPVVYCLFLLASLAACAACRVSEGAESAYTTSRYTLVSALLILFVSIEWARLYPNLRLLRVAWLGTAVVFSLWAYGSTYSFYTLRQDVIRDAALRWQLFEGTVFKPEFASYDDVFRHALERGVVKSHIIAAAAGENRLSPPGDPPAAMRARMELKREFFLRNSRYVYLSGYAFRRSDAEWSPRFFLVIKHGGERRGFECGVRERPDVALRHSTGRAARRSIGRSGFMCAVQIDPTWAADWQGYVLVENGGVTSYAPLEDL